MLKNKDYISQLLSDDDYRYAFQLRLICLVLGSVSLLMGIMNIFTHKQLLMIATMSFAALCYINFVDMKWLRKKCDIWNFVFFAVCMVVLFVYFLITGGTAGFSPIWILILPAWGMMFFGLKRGLALALFQFVVLIFLLWFPAGKALLVYDYSKEFLMRFPVVYATFFIIGYCFEKIRLSTYEAMVKMQHQLADIADTDTLTQIPNRHWFNETLKKFYLNRSPAEDGAMLILDIDDFKRINDTYGHNMGDEVLVQVAQVIKTQLRTHDMLCRWGGEEFFAYLPVCPQPSIFSIGDRIRAAVSELEFHPADAEAFRVSVSIGAVPIYHGIPINVERCFKLADDKLYEAKASGKNCVRVYR